MAQQTQIGRVGEAWHAFTSRFPTVVSLAAADQADVIRAWRGLGYNRRAINLWRAARAIVEEHGGLVPRSVSGLESLPGVGPYTARAVAAIAYGTPVGAVDTNVRRVLSRAVTGSISGIGGRELQALADTATPRDRAADWTHAVMDVGATYCRTSRPACGSCPAAACCRYAATGGAEEEPRDRIASRAGRAGGGFPATSRWLRGRILDELRDVEPGRWRVLVPPIGLHDASAVAVSLAALAADGLAEVDQGSPLRARLPIG